MKENNHDFQRNKKYGDSFNPYSKQTGKIKCQNECNNVGEFFDIEDISPKKTEEHVEHQDTNKHGIYVKSCRAFTFTFIWN